jgi:hypothetical protein
MLARASSVNGKMKIFSLWGLTKNDPVTNLWRMQAELDSISVVEPNVEARLDRIFARVGVLYAGDYRKFFNDLDATNTETLIESDLRIPIEALSCRFTDER